MMQQRISLKVNDIIVIEDKEFILKRQSVEPFFILMKTRKQYKEENNATL